MPYAIWYHLYNFKKVKNTHREVLLLVMLQAKVCNFTKSNTPPWVFFTFFELYNWYQIAQRITYSNKLLASPKYPANIYLHKVNRRNTEKRCKIYLKITKHQDDVIEVVLVFLLFTSNIFLTYF